MKSVGRDPHKWSDRALENYQRARSSAVTIIQADGSRRTVNQWTLERRRRANKLARRRNRSKRKNA